MEKTPTKLNLGCGKDIKKGYLNVDFEDFEKFEGVDKVYDLNKLPYPFKDNQFEVILMHNILEHLDDSYKVMKEIFRILKPGGIVHLYVPHFSSDCAWGDLQHKKGYSIGAFTAPDVTWMFKVIKNKICFNRFRLITPLYANIFPVFYERVLAYIFPASHLDVTLKKIKNKK
jgi:SAM-dependent methyltransferase